LTGNTILNVKGGTLEGHGTLAGNTTIGTGGTLKPGGSVGTLTIIGDLAFGPGSTYLVTLTPNQASLTNVTGNVTINGGSVVFDPQLGTGKTANVQILSAGGTVTGTFSPTASFVGSVVLVDPTISFTAQGVFLTDAGSALVLPANAPTNAQNVANAINSFIAGGGALSAGFTNLGNLTGDALNAAANQLAGQTQGSFAPVGFNAGR
jgi:outer membrane autotransporter protein